MKAWIVALIAALLMGCGGGDAAKTETPSDPAPPPSKPPDERAALEALATANEAQGLYFKRNRRYALTFDELVESRFLKSEPTAAETGYSFRLRPAADTQTYTMTASPVAAASNARYLFTDQTGVIRAEVDKDATAESPPAGK
jgi:hypothetical protein